MKIKCRKCRREMVEETNSTILLSPHGESSASHERDKCSSSEQDSLLFVDETSVSWILDAVNKTSWTKGKLICPKCEARVGSFDFVSRSKCACGSSVLPAVHIVKSKVDTSLGKNLLSLVSS